MPCTSDALLLHTKRASYQACIWKSALQSVLSAPPITGFGWNINEGKLEVHWMTLPAAPDCIVENVNCGCKSNSGCSTRRCACKKAELKCTGLCSCLDCPNKTNEAVSEETSDDEVTPPVLAICACVVATKTMAACEIDSTKGANFARHLFQFVQVYRLGRSGFL